MHGQEDDAYRSTALVLMEYSNPSALVDNGEEPAEDFARERGFETDNDGAPAELRDIDQTIERLPPVAIRLDATPKDLMPCRFLAAMVDRVLATTP